MYCEAVRSVLSHRVAGDGQLFWFLRKEVKTLAILGKLRERYNYAILGIDALRRRIFVSTTEKPSVYLEFAVSPIVAFLVINFEGYSTESNIGVEFHRQFLHYFDACYFACVRDVFYGLNNLLETIQIAYSLESFFLLVSLLFLIGVFITTNEASS